MEIVKKYLVWIVLAVLLLVLLGVQFFWVGGVRASAAAEHDEVKKKIAAVTRMNSSVRSYPTKLDLEQARDHLALIQKEGHNIQEIWRKLTDGLNRDMSNGEREKGEILNAETKEPVRWDYFATFLVERYRKMLQATRERLAKNMTPALVERLAVDISASDPQIKDPEAAKPQAQTRAAAEAERAARIFGEKGVIPLSEDEAFIDTTTNTPDIAKGWQYWRSYLIAEDVLGRAVAETRAEVKRWVPVAKAAPKPAGEEADAGEEGAPAPVVTEEKEFPDWRFIESVDLFTVEGPELGSAVLPGKDGKLPEKKKAAVTAAAKPGGLGAAARAAGLTGMPGGEFGPGGMPGMPGYGQKKPEEKPAETAYHDVFTVTIGLTAHIKAIEAFMAKLLEAPAGRSCPEIFYIPVSFTFERFPDNQAMGIFDPAQLKDESAATAGAGQFGGDPFGGRRGRTETANASGAGGVPVRRVAGSDYEPAVRATLVYKVYRFRFADTDNVDAEEAAAGK